MNKAKEYLQKAYQVQLKKHGLSHRFTKEAKATLDAFQK